MSRNRHGVSDWTASLLQAARYQRADGPPFTAAMERHVRAWLWRGVAAASATTTAFRRSVALPSTAALTSPSATSAFSVSSSSVPYASLTPSPAPEAAHGASAAAFIAVSVVPASRARQRRLPHRPGLR